MESAATSAGSAANSGGRWASRMHMTIDLGGVPKDTLRTVFGPLLGWRIWAQARRRQSVANPAIVPDSTTRPHAESAAGPPADVSDSDIIVGMIGYVSRRAAHTLNRNRREAGAIRLTLVYIDGVVRTDRTRLARPTSDAAEICASATDLFQRGQPRDVALESVNLVTTAAQTEAVLERVPPFTCAVAGFGT
jgi:hypothetical protein